MKKSTDILLRIILVVSILGTIFFYYYGKFITNRKIIVKSNVVKLPEYPVKKKIAKDNTTQSVQTNTNIKNYSIFINGYPLLSVVNDIKNFLEKNNIKYNIIKRETLGEFKRVFLGPYNKKILMIKDENKLKKIGIEPLRIKLRGSYFLHCGSYLFKEKANELKEKLQKNGFRNIVIFKFKKKIPVYDIEIENLNESNLKIVSDFLKSRNINFNVKE